MLQIKGARLIVARDGDSWTVGDADVILQQFETEADASPASRSSSTRGVSRAAAAQ